MAERLDDGRYRMRVARNLERRNLREDEFQVSRSVIREVDDLACTTIKHPLILFDLLDDFAVGVISCDFPAGPMGTP